MFWLKIPRFVGWSQMRLSGLCFVPDGSTSELQWCLNVKLMAKDACVTPPKWDTLGDKTAGVAEQTLNTD